MSYSIRLANLDDCERILEIYSPHILTTAASFELEVPSLDEYKNQFLAICSHYPWLVYEKNGQTLGYAYASSHRTRAAYAWSCEVAIYIDENFHRQGVGTALYTSLFPILKKQGFYNVFAGVTLPNDGSHRIHLKTGFQLIATYKNVGYKFDTWHDVAWYQLELNCGGIPEPSKAICNVTLEVTELLGKHRS